MNKIENIIHPDVRTPLPIDFYTNKIRLCSRTTLWKWSQEGLRTIRIGGRVFVAQSDLQRFMAEHDETGQGQREN